MAAPAGVTHADVERYELLLSYLWVCGDDFCDGMPHVRWPHRHARGSQHPPRGAWDVWALIAGRGAGKTRSGAEFVKSRILNYKGPKSANRAIIVAPTLAVARDVCVLGESGILAHTPTDRIRGAFNRQTQELIFTNGGIVKCFGADDLADADRIRGFQSHTIWYEEAAFMRWADAAWDNGSFANRLGSDPRIIVTTTPRPTRLVKKLLRDPDVKLSRGTTFDNQANLADAFVARVRKNYEGTRLEASELRGELVDEVAGALWQLEDIAYVRPEDVPELAKVVVGVDPAGTSKRANAQTGIVVVGMAADGRCYVLEDLSGWHEPEQWARLVVDAVYRHDAMIAAEVNFGGDLVVANIRQLDKPAAARIVTMTASRSKVVRAEPVANLYRRREVVHVGTMPDLEQQMVSWIPPGQFEKDSDGDPIAIPESNYSPDAIDALVWSVTQLRSLSGKHRPRARSSFHR